MIGDVAQTVMKFGNVLPLDIRHPAGSELGVDEQLDRAFVLSLSTRLAPHCDMLLEEALAQPFHSWGLARLVKFLGWVATALRLGQDLESPNTRLFRRDGTVRSDRNEPLTALNPALDDVDLPSAHTCGGLPRPWPDTKAEALELVVPQAGYLGV